MTPPALLLLLFALIGPPPVIPLARVPGFSRESASLVLARAGDRDVAVIAVDHTLRVVDLEAGTVLDTVADAAPNLLLLPDGRLACGSRSGVDLLAWHDDGKLRVVDHLATAGGPLALSPDDAVLYAATDRDARGILVTDTQVLVAVAASSEVLVVDRKTEAVKRTSLDATLLDVAPIGEDILTSGEDGKDEWTFAFGMGTAHTMGARGQVSVRSRHAYGLVRAGREILIAHHELVPSAPVTDSEIEAAKGYGGVGDLGSTFSAVTSLDAATGARKRTYASPACGLPRASMWYAGRLWGACEGEDRLQVVSRTNGVYRAGEYWHRPTHGAFFEERASVHVCAGPNALARDEAKNRLVVGCAHAISVLALDTPKEARTTALGVEDLGQALFRRTDDRRVSADGRSCATCHIEGATDHLVWSTPHGLRKTPVLAGRLSLAALPAHITSTFNANLRGRGLDDEATDALAHYVSSRPAPPGDPSARGAEVFHETGCDGCHVDGGTDGERHDVGSGGLFRTPSLAGLGRAGPYFHDGRYRSLEQLLTKTDGKMGTTRALSPSDREALLGFLRAR